MEANHRTDGCRTARATLARADGPGSLHSVSVSDIWLAALSPSGEVLGVGGGAPEGWVGAALDGRKGVPAPVQEAARAVVAEVRGGRAVARRAVEVPELGASVELVAVAAVGLHRAATDVRALLRVAVAALDRQARALDVGLTVTVEPDVPDRIDVDAEKIAWAVATLVGNAMRYVHRGTRQMPGGSISVTASRDAARGSSAWWSRTTGRVSRPGSWRTCSGVVRARPSRRRSR